MIKYIILIMTVILVVYRNTHKDRWNIDRHAKLVGIKPRLFETDKHLKDRIMYAILFKDYFSKTNGGNIDAYHM